MLRSMGLPLQRRVQRGLARVLAGFWAGAREVHAARSGQPREESHRSLTAPISMRRSSQRTEPDTSRLGGAAV